MLWMALCGVFGFLRLAWWVPIPTAAVLTVIEVYAVSSWWQEIGISDQLMYRSAGMFASGLIVGYIFFFIGRLIARFISPSRK
jgi:hypothetical protein